MLVLRRKPGESVVADEDIWVKVLGIGPDGETVHLGFTAPDEVGIYREEVYKRIQAEEEVNGNR